MYTYYTAQEINQKYWESFTKDKPFEDQWSRDLIKHLLTTFGQNYKSVYEYQGNNCLDLKLTMSNKSHTGIEIKFRADSSNKYPSHLINEEKFNSISNKRNKGIIQGAYLATIWYDGVIWISDVFGNFEIEQHLQNRTTNVSYTTDGKKEWKSCYCYKPNLVYYFCYEVDEETKQITPIFSKEPFNVPEMNRKAQEIKSIPLF